MTVAIAAATGVLFGFLAGGAMTCVLIYLFVISQEHD